MSAADELGAAISEPEIYDLRPVFMLHRLLDAHTTCVYDLDGQDRRKGTRAYGALVVLAERHEPQAHKVARRCAEIYDAAGGDGAAYFVEHVDAVLEGGDGLMPNPDSKYFAPLFVEAWNDRGRRDRKVRALLALIKRVDEGADLNQLAEEDKRAWAEYAEACKPKDMRLAEALSAILRNSKTSDETTNRIGDVMCNLSNETRVDDLHPDVFETLTRVYVREARKAARGRSRKARNLRRYLGELEAIAADE